MPIDQEQPAFMRLPVRLIPTVLKALEDSGEVNAAKEVRSFTKHYTDEDLNKYREEWVARAEDLHGRDGEVEFDSDSTVSGSEGGEYVLAWVWVADDDDDEDEEEEDTDEEE